jgi:hypothetical protein
MDDANAAWRKWYAKQPVKPSGAAKRRRRLGLPPFVPRTGPWRCVRCGGTKRYANGHCQACSRIAALERYYARKARQT